MGEIKQHGRMIGARQNNIGEKPDSTVGGGKQLAGHALENLQEKIGDRAENVIGNVMENTRFEAPELRVRPGQDASHQIPGMETYQWYRVPVEGGKTADGSEYHIYVKKGTTDHLCVFLSGGGIAWNPYTAARPVTGGRVLAWHPGYPGGESEGWC